MKTITIELPTMNQVDFQTICSEEEIPVRGNAIASGDDEEDTKTENYIINQLEDGNIWAWCAVEVRASWKGISGSDYLGACSYKSQEDFERPGGYYDDMKAEAFEDLLNQIKRLAEDR